MASMAVKYWRTVRQLSTTATAHKMRPFTPAAADIPDHYYHHHHHHHHGSAKQRNRWVKGQYVPVYVALGLISVSFALGCHTAKQQLVNSPTVRVSKKKRETLPEVEDPELVARESDRFINKSLFRRVAHLRDFDAVRAGINDPSRPHPFKVPRKVEDLRTVGVDPRMH